MISFRFQDQSKQRCRSRAFLFGRPKAWQTSRAKARLLTEDSSAKTSAVVDLETTQKQEASNARRLDSGLLIRRLQVRVLLGVLMGGGIAEAEGQPPTVLTTQGNPG